MTTLHLVALTIWILALAMAIVVFVRVWLPLWKDVQLAFFETHCTETQLTEEQQALREVERIIHEAQQPQY